MEEAAGAGVEEFGVVVCPGDEVPYAEACGGLRARVRFIVQEAPRGYGDAVRCGQPFIGHEPFLHLVGDHLQVSHGSQSCARQLLEVAASEKASISAVQATRGSGPQGGARQTFHLPSGSSPFAGY